MKERFAWSTVALALAACSGGGDPTTPTTPSTPSTPTTPATPTTPTTPTTPVTPTVARVNVTAPAGPLYVRGAVQLTASITDASGAAIAGKSATWTSATPGVATVSGTGLVAALAVGSSIVTASSDGVTGSMIVTVSVRVDQELVPVIGMNLKRVDGNAVGAIARN